MSDFDNNKLAEEVAHKVENSKVLKTIDEVKNDFFEIQKSLTSIMTISSKIAEITIDVSKSTDSIKVISAMLKDIKETTGNSKEKLLALDPQLNSMKDTLQKFNTYGDDIKHLSKLSENISKLDRSIENFLIKTGVYFGVAVVGFGIISAILKPLFIILIAYVKSAFIQ